MLEGRCTGLHSNAVSMEISISSSLVHSTCVVYYIVVQSERIYCKSYSLVDVGSSQLCQLAYLYTWTTQFYCVFWPCVGIQLEGSPKMQLSRKYQVESMNLRDCKKLKCSPMCSLEIVWMKVNFCTVQFDSSIAQEVICRKLLATKCEDYKVLG